MAAAAGALVTLFLGGDVMTGRGIDQILPHPDPPALHEAWVRDARRYVTLAEAAHGPIPRAVAPSYVWGDALATLDAAHPDARIVNLETAVTTRDDFWPDKPVCYRMHPANLAALAAARLDVAILANNHAGDFGRAGLADTVDNVTRAGLAVAGAGRDLAAARAPAVVPLAGGRRLLVFALATWSSGAPAAWRAGPHRPGIDYAGTPDDATADELAARIAAARRPGDLVVVSLHWGTNWGWDVPDAHVRFAHRLVDGGADVVFGHSSHHARPVEVYRGHLILYGAGDLIDDYEGIGDDGEFRPDLALLWLPTLDDAGRLVALRMVPLQMWRFRLRRAAAADVGWLAATLDHACARFGCGVTTDGAGALVLRLSR